jgi:opine dehydrogenase
MAPRHQAIRGILGEIATPRLLDELREIHAYEKVYSDTLEAGFSIVNPAVHSGPCLLSITAIENWPKRPFFLYEHGVTPASCKINLKIDNERKAIGKKLGYSLTPIEDFSGLKQGYSWQELYMSIHGNISLTPISGPHDIMGPSCAGMSAMLTLLKPWMTTVHGSVTRAS